MLIAALAQYLFGISIFVSSVFLILLVLVQRGRGGGLTGALGGPGGQSAFGTKAGDLFTRITVGVAAVWILLCAMSVISLKSRDLPTFGSGTAGSSSASGSMGGTDEGTDTENNSLGTDSNGLNSGAGLGSGGSLTDLPLDPIDPVGNAQAEITDLPNDTDSDSGSGQPESGSSNPDDTSDDESQADPDAESPANGEGGGDANDSTPNSGQ